MATAAAAVAAKARRDIQHYFFSHDAVRPDRAVSFEPERMMQQRQFERMRALGIIREASPGLYWLEVVAYDSDLRQRHSRIVLVPLVIVVLFALGLGASITRQ